MTPDNLAAQAAHTLLLSAHDPERALAMLLTRLERHPETATDRAMADMAAAALDVRRDRQRRTARELGTLAQARRAAQKLGVPTRDVQAVPLQPEDCRGLPVPKAWAQLQEQELRAKLAEAQAKHAEAMEAARRTANASARAECDLRQAQARRQAEDDRLATLAAKAAALRAQQQASIRAQQAQDDQEARAAWAQARTDAHYP